MSSILTTQSKPYANELYYTVWIVHCRAGRVLRVVLCYQGGSKEGSHFDPVHMEGSQSERVVPKREESTTSSCHCHPGE